ncbi:hypothetical protein [Gloeocapsopsis dulcis]|nr:hypothetical protein [Gloeocapsopsis dulcis]WNN91491.1 hypothetical protein P0S91_10640 [Gloeocapsopsis dulcis]
MEQIGTKYLLWLVKSSDAVAVEQFTLSGLAKDPGTLREILVAAQAHR